MIGLSVNIVWGESREECVAINNTQAIVIIEPYGYLGEVGSCNWIVNEVLQNGQYKLNTFTDEYIEFENLWLFLK